MRALGRNPHVSAGTVAGLLLAACAMAAPLAAQLPEGLPGHYTLIEIEGHALPYAPVEPGRPADAPALEVLASTLIVQPDGHFTMAMAYRVRQPGGEHIFTNPFTGTIAPDSGGYVMHWDGAGLTPATWEPERFTFRNEGQAFAYRRDSAPRPSGR